MRHLGITAIFSCILLQSLAQTDSVSVRLTDTLVKESTEVSLFTLGTIYGTNEYYYGQSPEDKLPYLQFYAGYGSKRGFTFSVSTEKLLNESSGIDATDIYVGYGFKLSKSLNANIGYSHYFYPKNSPLLETTNPNSLSGGFTYNWGIKSSLNANFTYGNDNDFLLSFRNSKTIDLGRLFSDKDYILVEPAMDIIGGTVHFYKTYITRQDIARALLKLPPRGAMTIEYTGFNVIAYSFSLPVSYNRPSYSLEASYHASVTTQKFSSGSSSSAGVFNLAFYYSF